MTTTYSATTSKAGAAGTCQPGTVKANVWRAAYTAWAGTADEPVAVVILDGSGVVWNGTVYPDGRAECEPRFRNAYRDGARIAA